MEQNMTKNSDFKQWLGDIPQQAVAELQRMKIR
jgi:hypothetical protein